MFNFDLIAKKRIQEALEKGEFNRLPWSYTKRILENLAGLPA